MRWEAATAGRRALARGAALAGLMALASGALVAAQPPAPAAPTPPATAPASTAESADEELPEEAPPINIAPPAPLATPPIQPEEVAPAAPPKTQVVEKPIETPAKRPRFDVAVIQALDKVTAETVRFEAAVGRPVRYKNLVFTVRACERSAPEEPVEDAMVYLSVESQPRAAPGKPTPAPRNAFRGWMYASSPGLNPLEHPVYDAWLITCRTAAPGASAGSR